VNNLEINTQIVHTQMISAVVMISQRLRVVCVRALAAVTDKSSFYSDASPTGLKNPCPSGVIRGQKIGRRSAPPSEILALRLLRLFAAQ
jgi:hypothetical protein